MLVDSLRIIWSKQTLNSNICWNLVEVFVPILTAEYQKDLITRQSAIFSLFDTSLLRILAIFCFRSLLWDFRFETTGLLTLFLQKIQ